jgi:hypothetical protein
MQRLMYSSKTSPKKFVNVFRALPMSELAMIQYMPCVKRSRSNRRLTQTSEPSGNSIMGCSEKTRMAAHRPASPERSHSERTSSL